MYARLKLVSHELVPVLFFTVTFTITFNLQYQ